MKEPRPLVMKLSLNVLQHLGLNLYSNVPAVLSEVVANAWDADTEKVQIDLDKGQARIVIKDDGSGMTRDEVIDRFLLMGYQRRISQPGPTPKKGRSPMGRKGIGKLSLFSIANEITVETNRDGERTALRMRLDTVKDAIEKNNGEYYPEELTKSNFYCEHGTRITLGKLRKRQTISTAEGLRKRLARRFSIIGPSHDFAITVNGKQITSEDRGYHDRLQYLWMYGDQSLILSRCGNLDEKEQRESIFPVPEGADLTVDGWLGTVRESGQLRDEHGENLNRIAIYVRGKMAQEDLLSDFTERGIYASYLIGELRVDGLDTTTGNEREPDEEPDEDSATSSRQRIVEDDLRYVALKKFVAGELKVIQQQWSDLRRDDGSRVAMQIPEVKEWAEALPREISNRAKSWLGKINRLRIDDPNERRQLIKHAVIAFEFHRWNERLIHLESINDENLESVLSMFSELDGLEKTLYGQIVRNRVQVIKIFQDMVDNNTKERAIQEYIFEHLWLLDPSWERIETSKLMETRVGNLFREIDADLLEEEKNARLDIKYRKTAGKHVIIELKRPDRSVSVYDLSKQIAKYRNGLMKTLAEMGTPHEPFEFVCLMGNPPNEWDNPDGQTLVENTLKAHNARYVNYDELLENSYQAYSDYLQRGQEVEDLSRIIAAIDDFGDK